MKKALALVVLASLAAVSACDSKQRDVIENVTENQASNLDNQADQLEDKANNMVGVAKDHMENAADALSNSADQVRNVGDALADKVDKAVKDHK